jgi:hypothetical protein
LKRGIAFSQPNFGFFFGDLRCQEKSAIFGIGWLFGMSFCKHFFDIRDGLYHLWILTIAAPSVFNNVLGPFSLARHCTKWRGQDPTKEQEGLGFCEVLIIVTGHSDLGSFVTPALATKLDRGSH